MKTLVVSIKPAGVILDEVLGRLEHLESKIKNKTDDLLSAHHEISFSDMKDYKRFVSNLDVLKTIKISKPGSIYELAKILKKDIGNVNKLVNFFEETGAVVLEDRDVNGRTLKKPTVPFERVELDLTA